jgi:hypothetical protein
VSGVGVSATRRQLSEDGREPRVRRAPLGLIFIVVGVIALGGALMFRPDQRTSPRAIATTPTTNVVVTIEPKGVEAEVSVDGQRQESHRDKPVMVHGLSIGRAHRVRVTAPGYSDYEKLFTPTASPGDVEPLEVELRALTGSIDVRQEGTADPIACDHGRVEGDRILDVPLNTPVEVRVVRKDGKPWSTTVTVESVDTPLEVQVPKLPPASPGTLIVNSRPYSEVLLNGKDVGQTPQTLTLPPGSYRIVLKRPDGQTWNHRAQVRSGNKLTVTHPW